MEKRHSLANYDSDTDDSGEFMFHNPFLLEDDKFEKEFEKTLALFDALLIGEDSLCDSFSINSPLHSLPKHDTKNSQAKSSSGSAGRIIESLPEQSTVELSNSFVDAPEEERPKSFLHDEVSEFNRLLKELSETPLTGRHSYLTLGKCGSPKGKHSFHTHSSSVSLPLQTHSDRCASSPDPSDGQNVCPDSDALFPRKDNNITTDEDDLFKASSTLRCELSEEPLHLCQNCIPLKQKACKEIIESGYFDSLKQLQSTSTEEWRSSSIDRRGSRYLGTRNNRRTNFHYFSESSLDLIGHPCFPGYKKDEPDSAYQTGNSDTLTSSSASLALLVDGLSINEDCLGRSPSRINLECKLTNYNQNKTGLSMELPSVIGNFYRGTMRVHMNLTQPINMQLAPTDEEYDHTVDDLQQPAYDSILRKKPPNQNLLESQLHTPGKRSSFSADLPHSLPELSKHASFHLPVGVSKVIHVSSRSTTPEVIKILLEKFHIVNSAQKFALLQKTFDKPVEDKEDRALTCHLRRLGNEECPLEILLKLVDEADLEILNRVQFVLQEYSPGEIIWDAFSIPELNNFLVILDREEFIKIAEVERRYAEVKRIFKRRMEELSGERETMC